MKKQRKYELIHEWLKKLDDSQLDALIVRFDLMPKTCVWRWSNIGMMGFDEHEWQASCGYNDGTFIENSTCRCGRRMERER